MPMIPGVSSSIDFSTIWTWVLPFSRMSGLFFTLPGIGTDRVPMSLRALVVMALSIVISLAGVKVELPRNELEIMVAIVSEAMVGFLLGSIPAFIIAAVGVGGQVTAGAMGLAQANMIDPSLGESTTAIAQVQMLIATLVFLLVDGHHAVIQAASGMLGDVGVGAIRPAGIGGALLLEQLSHGFEIALSLSGPVLVAALVTQMVLALMTRFIPQINIFIISVPVTIALGFYIVVFSMSVMSEHLADEYARFEEEASKIVSAR